MARPSTPLLDSLDSGSLVTPLLDLQKLTVGLSRTWAGSCGSGAGRCDQDVRAEALSPPFGASSLKSSLPVGATRTLEVSLDGGAESGAREEIPIGACKRVRDQRLRSLGVRDANVELCDLVLGQATPGPASPAPAGEQPTDLLKREPGVLAEPNQRDALCGRRRVVPSLTSTLGR